MTEHSELYNRLKWSSVNFRDQLSRKAEEMRAHAVAEEPLHREMLLKIADDLALIANAAPAE